LLFDHVVEHAVFSIDEGTSNAPNQAVELGDVGAICTNRTERTDLRHIEWEWVEWFLIRPEAQTAGAARLVVYAVPQIREHRAKG